MTGTFRNENRWENLDCHNACILECTIGEGVHVVTVNEYLATRDSNEMGELYNFLGLALA